MTFKQFKRKMNRKRLYKILFGFLIFVMVISILGLYATTKQEENKKIRRDYFVSKIAVSYITDKNYIRSVSINPTEDDFQGIYKGMTYIKDNKIGDDYEYIVYLNYDIPIKTTDPNGEVVEEVTNRQGYFRVLLGEKEGMYFVKESFTPYKIIIEDVDVSVFEKVPQQVISVDSVVNQQASDLTVMLLETYENNYEKLNSLIAGHDLKELQMNLKFDLETLEVLPIKKNGNEITFLIKVDLKDSVQRFKKQYEIKIKGNAITSIIERGI